MNSFISLNSLKQKREGILNLSSKKSSPKGDIPAKILKVSIEFIINDLRTFPAELEIADVSPIFKKKNSLF